jgi:phage/plasmid-like protein (TIGR03299 family)
MQETQTSKQVIIGHADERAHYGTDSYSGAIPQEDVIDKLFSWSAVSAPISATVAGDFSNFTTIDEEGTPLKSVLLDSHKAIMTSDTNELLGIFKKGYKIHQYRDWTIANAKELLATHALSISAAGLVKNRAVAFVEFSAPETIHTPEGISFRPSILAATSHDGSLANVYMPVTNLIICDNMLKATFRSAAVAYRLRHTSGSAFDVLAARDALGMIATNGETFAQEVARLTAQTVTEVQWADIVERLVPMPEKTEDSSTRATTIAENKRVAIDELYRYDSRVSPWSGSAFGVLQAFNTYTHHVANIQGNTIRQERNFLNAITAKTAAVDTKVLDTIELVLA